MAQLFAATSQNADQLAVRHANQKWSRQASTLVIATVSLVSWLAVGGALHYVLAL